VIRIAAVGDLHVGVDSAGSLCRALAGIEEHADVLLLAGDLTRRGERAEAEVLAAELRDVPVPLLAVLGNHDHHSGCAEVVTEILQGIGVRLVDGAAETLEVRDVLLGVAGTKGFGGGFVGASGSDFGEKEMKAFVRHSMELAAGLEAGLRVLADRGAHVRVALTHYSPVRETLEGEPPEIFPFLGSYFLAEAIDAAGADLALHGHAHRGSELGTTAGGVPVRNVAQPVIEAPYRVFELGLRGRVPSGVGAFRSEQEGARGTDS
jgi:Icc-related predicted phosphoesterase